MRAQLLGSCTSAQQAALVAGIVPDWIGAEACAEAWAALPRGDALHGVAACAQRAPKQSHRRLANIGCDEFARLWNIVCFVFKRNAANKNLLPSLRIQYGSIFIDKGGL